MKVFDITLLSVWAVLLTSSLTASLPSEGSSEAEEDVPTTPSNLEYEEDAFNELTLEDDLTLGDDLTLEEELKLEEELEDYYEEGEEEFEGDYYDYEEEDDLEGEAPIEGSHREGRQQKRKRRQSCTSLTSNKTRGSCIGRRSCLRNRGTASGRCGPRGFVCCFMEKSCAEATSQNDTMFINFGYPSPDSGTGACSLTINRLNSNICQMRFDFITLELSQPDSNGNCVTDFLSVTGGTSASPIICGKNSGQHMYVDVDPEGGAVRLTVDRTAASMSDRMWKVKVSQIECTSKFRAPAGCLQYFTETSGTVSSFNFDQLIDEEAVPQSTRQIVDMNYAVCVQMSDGYCSIMWTRNDTGGDFGFTMSSNIAGLSRSLIGDPASSSNSGVCDTDYVVIPGSVDDLGRQNDRFCGAGFPNQVTSHLRPFLMYVTTDSNEQDDVLNRGFSLDYRQRIC